MQLRQSAAAAERRVTAARTRSRPSGARTLVAEPDPQQQAGAARGVGDEHTDVLRGAPAEVQVGPGGSGAYGSPAGRPPGSPIAARGIESGEPDRTGRARPFPPGEGEHGFGGIGGNDPVT
jgi:hypothetical protein